MAGGFRRSSRFGIVGVLVVMAACGAIGLTLGGGEANPKLALGLIFGVVAVFFVVLFIPQRSDLNRVSGAAAPGGARAAAEGGREIENPMTMSESDLWAAMAVVPIGSEAVKARAADWKAGRRSQNLGMVVVLLIFLTVPPIYFFESFVPPLIGGPLIVIAALWGSIRALMPGGEMDQGYANVGKAMARWRSRGSATGTAYRSASTAPRRPAAAWSRWALQRPSSRRRRATAACARATARQRPSSPR